MVRSSLLVLVKNVFEVYLFFVLQINKLVLKSNSVLTGFHDDRCRTWSWSRSWTWSRSAGPGPGPGQLVPVSWSRSAGLVVVDDEEDDDGRQKQQHQDQQDQEEGPAGPLTRDPDQGPAHGAGPAPGGRAGKPHVQRAAGGPQRPAPPGAGTLGGPERREEREDVSSFYTQIYSVFVAKSRKPTLDDQLTVEPRFCRVL